MKAISRIVEQAGRNGHHITRWDVLKAVANGDLRTLLAQCGVDPLAVDAPSVPAPGAGDAPSGLPRECRGRQAEGAARRPFGLPT